MMTKRAAQVHHPLAGWSDDVFKTAWLLPVAAAIRACSDGRFTQKQLAARFQVSSSAIGPVLQKLRAGILVKDGQWVDGCQEIHVVDRDHPFWLFIDGLMDRSSSAQPL